MYEEYKVNLKEGTVGDWTVENFEVTQEDHERQKLRSMFGNGRMVRVGKYTRLKHQNTVIMSDTPDEIRDHREFIRRASGKVLINGLGIGMALNAVIEKESVEHVTVVEISKDVIDLVGSQYKKMYGDKLTIINANALEYISPKNERYDAVWHDIWTYICVDNLDDMKKLHRKYGRKCDWQGSWCRSLCEMYAKRG